MFPYSIRPKLTATPLDDRICPIADLVIDQGEVWNIGDEPSAPYRIRQYYSHSATLDDPGQVVVGTIDMPSLDPNMRDDGFDSSTSGAENNYSEVGTNGAGRDHLDPSLVSTDTVNVPTDMSTWTPEYTRYNDYLFNTGRYYVIYELLGPNSGGIRQYGSYVDGFRVETPGFDLTGESMALDVPRTYAVGEQFGVTLRVKNQGAVASPPKAIQFLLMPVEEFDNFIITPTDTVSLGVRNIAPIPSSGSVFYDAILSVPTGITPGTWYVQAVLDPVRTTWGDDTKNGIDDPDNNNFSVGLGIDRVALTCVSEIHRTAASQLTRESSNSAWSSSLPNLVETCCSHSWSRNAPSMSANVGVFFVVYHGRSRST